MFDKITIILVSTMLLTLFNIPKVGLSQTTLQTPFKMPYKTFQLEVLHGQSAIVYYQGTMYLNLTLTSALPMGTLYDPVRKVVYVALYAGCSNPDIVWGIAEINITDFSYKIYRFPWLIDYYGYDPEWGPQMYCGPIPWTIAKDGNGELWISIRDYLATPNHPPSNIPYLAKLNIYNNTLYIYYIPKELCAGCDIKLYNGYIWYLTNNGLSKINYTSEEIVESYMRGFYGGFMDTDSDALWISSVSGNFVTRFSIVTRTFDLNLTGFDRPLGIDVDEKYVYVAENSRNSDFDTIAIIDKVLLNVSRIKLAPRTNEGTYYVYKSVLGNIWWTDNSKHFGVVLSNGTKLFFQSISPFNCFISELPGNTILFSCKGSALTGIVKDICAAAQGSSAGAGGRRMLT
jgi:hypothetical protein